MLSRLDAVLAKRQPDLTVYAENLHKPRNFSAMVRNCDAVGINEMHVTANIEEIRTHWKTSQGSEKWMHIRLTTAPKKPVPISNRNGFRLVAAHLSDEAVDYREIDYTQPIALVLGTELFGVSDATLSFVDQQISIPMMGVSQSLNVSVACAIVLYEAQRQRQAAGMYGAVGWMRKPWPGSVLNGYTRYWPITAKDMVWAIRPWTNRATWRNPMPRAGK